MGAELVRGRDVQLLYRCKLRVRYPQIRLEVKISMYGIQVCFCLNVTFFLVTHSFHQFRYRRCLIFELICEPVKIYAFRNPESTCRTAYQCFIFASIQTPQCSVVSTYHIFLEEHMFSEYVRRDHSREFAISCV